jgi:ribosomal protein S13
MTKIKSLAEAIKKTGEVNAQMLKTFANELLDCWVVNQHDCAKYLTDDEFEQLQGLIKKVELLKDLKEKEEKNEKTITKKTTI